MELKNTKSFKKRFHGLSLKDKISVAGLVNECRKNKQLPSGRKMKADEITMIVELCEWCDDNIFFNRMPNGEFAPHTYGLK